MSSPFLVFDYLEVPESFPGNYPLSEFIKSGCEYSYSVTNSSGSVSRALYTIVMANGQNWLACADADLIDRFYVMRNTDFITLYHPSRFETDRIGNQWRINLFEINGLIDSAIEPYKISRSLLVKIRPVASVAARHLISKLQTRKP